MANKFILAFVIKITPGASGGHNYSSVLAQEVPIFAEALHLKVELDIEEPLPRWEISIWGI